MKIFTRILSKLSRDERGVVAVIGALSILLTAGISVYATDVARIQIAKGRVQAAADAAMLAAARDLGGDEATLQAMARQVFEANLVGAPRDLDVRGFELTLGAGDGESLELQVDADLPMLMGGLADAVRLSDIASVNIVSGGSAERQSMGLEVVMVLDNTGSMRGQPIVDLRTAALTLTNILYGDAEAVPNLFVGVVNYSSTVNIGRQHWDWMRREEETDCEDGDDDDCVGSAGPVVFGPAATSLADIDASFGPAQWKGCVMARSEALAETDDPPAVGGLITPRLWPSSVLQRDPLVLDGFMIANRQHANVWPPVQGLSMLPSWWSFRRLVNAGEAVIDTGRPAVDERQEAGNAGYGPNLNCPAASTPLTALREDIVNAINGAPGVDRVDAWRRGGTFGNFGLAWGWRMLSPRWRGLWRDRNGVANPTLPQDYDTPFSRKVIVLMTDGRNEWSRTDYTAYGRPGEIIDADDIDTSMLRLCDNIKQAGVILYTITFGSVPETTRDLYRACASDPVTELRIPGQKYFHAPSGGQLTGAFSDIGGQVTEVRLRR